MLFEVTTSIWQTDSYRKGREVFFFKCCCSNCFHTILSGVYFVVGFQTDLPKAMAQMTSSVGCFD